MNLLNFHTEPHLLLSTIKDVLGYKDMRSAVDWCHKNGVYIIQQGNRQCVNTSEFILSFYKPFINHLKAKHKNWKELFLHYLQGNISQLLPDSPASFHSEKGKYSSRKSDSSFLNLLKKL